MSLKTLEEKEAVREVIDRFANLECDVASQMVFFTDDTHVLVSMSGKKIMDIHGKDELYKTFSAFTCAVRASQHMNGQQVITLDGKRASDRHVCRALLLTEEEGGLFLTDNAISYDDTLVKTPEGWKISERIQNFVIVKKEPFKEN